MTDSSGLTPQEREELDRLLRAMFNAAEENGSYDTYGGMRPSDPIYLEMAAPIHAVVASLLASREHQDSQGWQWFGNAAHFICGRWCRFHLATQVGEYLVSTVGEYVPGDGVQTILAESRGITLTGKGEAREAEFLEKVGFEEIGYQRTYETMVFKAGKPCDAEGCGCGMPMIDGRELDFTGYNDAGTATRGHREMCEKWASSDAARSAEGKEQANG